MIVSGHANYLYSTHTFVSGSPFFGYVTCALSAFLWSVRLFIVSRILPWRYAGLIRRLSTHQSSAFPAPFPFTPYFLFPVSVTIAGTLLAVSLLTVVSVARVASPITSYTATFDLVS
jgi:hypothetical protein